MKQAPRVSYSRLSTKHQHLGFTPSKSTTSLFFFAKQDVTMFVLVYVDDIIVERSISLAVEKLLNQLWYDFALKDLGDLHYLLGIEVKTYNDGLLLTQEKYATDLLAKVGMTECKSAPTPLSSTEILSLTEGIPLDADNRSEERRVGKECRL